MTDSTGSLMARLREATRDLHEHAESRPLQRQMFQGTVDRGDFAAYLGQLYLVHRGLEAALARAAELDRAVAAVARSDRRHEKLLLEDLGHHGVVAAAVQPGPSAERLLAEVERLEREQPVALLGPLYVLEGSTNGSRVLARVLSRAWGSDGAGLAYLDPYGDGQPTCWKAFKQEVDDLGLDDASQSAVVEAARVTFQAISDISDEVARRDGIGARHGADSAA